MCPVRALFLLSHAAARCRLHALFGCRARRGWGSPPHSSCPATSCKWGVQELYWIPATEARGKGHSFPIRCRTCGPVSELLTQRPQAPLRCTLHVPRRKAPGNRDSGWRSRSKASRLPHVCNAWAQTLLETLHRHCSRPRKATQGRGDLQAGQHTGPMRTMRTLLQQACTPCPECPSPQLAGVATGGWIAIAALAGCLLGVLATLSVQCLSRHSKARSQVGASPMMTLLAEATEGGGGARCARSPCLMSVLCLPPHTLRRMRYALLRCRSSRLAAATRPLTSRRSWPSPLPAGWGAARHRPASRPSQPGPPRACPTPAASWAPATAVPGCWLCTKQVRCGYSAMAGAGCDVGRVAVLVAPCTSAACDPCLLTNVVALRACRRRGTR